VIAGRDDVSVLVDRQLLEVASTAAERIAAEVDGASARVCGRNGEK